MINESRIVEVPDLPAVLAALLAMPEDPATVFTRGKHGHVVVMVCGFRDEGGRTGFSIGKTMYRLEDAAAEVERRLARAGVQQT